MDLQSRKLSFIEDFLRIQNEDIIAGLEALLKKKKAKIFEENLRPMSLKKNNEDIDQALYDSKEGRIISTENLKEKIQKWN